MPVGSAGKVWKAMERSAKHFERSPEHFETIIIGAGISGLACAQRLFQHDHWRQAGRVCVLEARDRIGGRIESVNVHGCRLDTGANWIHGVGTDDEPNPLMDILPDKRLRKLEGSVLFRPSSRSSPIETSRKNDDGGSDWVTVSSPVPPSSSPTMSTKDLIIPAEEAGELSAAMWGTIGALHEVAHERSPAESKATTILSEISKVATFREAFETTDPKYHDVLKAMPQFVEGMEAAPLHAMSAESQEDKPGVSLLEYKIDDFDGDQAFLQDGYAAVADDVAKGLLDAGVIRCGVEVEQLDCSTRPLTIHTTDGIYTADNVVCTLPLGVLKRCHTSLFQPALPDRTREAITSLGFGTLDKIFLVYDNPWWAAEPFASLLRKGLARVDGADATESTFNEPDFLIGFTSALPGIAIDRDGSVAEGPRMLSLTNLHSLTGFPVLGCFVSCANARYIESLTDKQAGDLLHDELTAWFGREPPKPAAVHVSRWATDPFSMGSYSHMITGLSERRHREEFQKPLEGGRLRFAGEHTSSDHFATVHGALISGWDAADGIVEDLKTGWGLT